MNSGRVLGMADEVPLPGKTQRGDALMIGLDRILGRHFPAGDRPIVAAALLVALIPQRVLNRPDPRPTTLVPRWAVDLLRNEVEENSPGLIEDLKEVLRKAGQNV